jgi:phenylpropionate dioxygenase-like ring-hydroxylating dioxygenase large terminal subunit
MLENSWYCAAWSHELSHNGAVLGRKLLNRNIALFRDSHGQVHAICAVCPHRGADLARGRVIDDVIECPLHGWRFDAKGKCVCVPSQPGDVKLPHAYTPSYLVTELQGMIWIWLGAERELVPNPPHYDLWDSGLQRHRHFNPPQLWKCTFVNAVENAIDTTHIPFVHTRTLGADQRRIYPRQKLVIDEDLRGFSGEDFPGSPWGKARTVYLMSGVLGRLAKWLLGLGTIEREHYRFDLGGSLVYQIEWQAGTWDALVAHCTPADPQHTWFFGLSIRTRATHWIGDLAQLWFNRMLCKEDEVEVTNMLSNDPELLTSPISVVGDEPTLAFRRIYKHHLSRQET